MKRQGLLFNCHCEAPKGLWQSHKEENGFSDKGIPTSGFALLGLTY